MCTFIIFAAMMRSKNGVAAALGFLMVLISMYFGSSIYNSKSNSPISYLNEMDHIHYYDVDLIPNLNFNAAAITLPFILILLFLQIWISLKATISPIRNIGRGLLCAVVIILAFDVLILSNPEQFDFSKWGYIWITLGIVIIAGNAFSVFIKGPVSSTN